MVGDYMGTLGDVRFCPLALLFCPAAQTGLAGLRGRLDKGYSSKRGISCYLSFSQSVHHSISSHHTQRTWVRDHLVLTLPLYQINMVLLVP